MYATAYYCKTYTVITAQKMKLNSVKRFFSKSEQIRSFLRIY